MRLPAVLLVLLSAPHAAWGASLGEQIEESVYFRFYTQGFGRWIDVRPSPLNPQNFLGIPSRQLGLDLRPDVEVDAWRFELSAKPRLELRWERFDGGAEERDASFFVNEWLARLRVADPLFVSYGRRNLQWGPSYLLSPSNPFNANNGESNPRIEVPGLDYAEALWIPGRLWSVQAIANTNRGRLDPRLAFSRTYALKADANGHRVYASAVGSYREENEAFRVGGYAGWTVSDAVMLYVEGSSPEVLQEGDVLVGGVYTFEGGPFAAAELYHHGRGCVEDPIDQCFFPHGASDPAELLFRKNYALLQFTYPRAFDAAQITARWTVGLDDGSSRLVGIWEHELTDRFAVFAIGSADLGEAGDEFRSVVGGSVMAGVSFVE